MSEFQTIQLEIDPRGVATLWLDRAEKNNAFNAVVIDELLQAIDRVGSDPQVRLLVLRGRGRHFCGGADLAWMQQSVDLDYQGNLADAQRIAELMTHLYNLPKPTLAVVQGAVFGGGVGLVSCCDMAIGSDEATFCLSEVRIGLIPATIAPFVVKAIGQRASELGLLSESCPAAELESQAEAWIANLLQNSPRALVACKALYHEVEAAELSPALRRYTEAAIARIRISPEGQEGLRAFLEKRTPAWRNDA